MALRSEMPGVGGGAEAATRPARPQSQRQAAPREMSVPWSGSQGECLFTGGGKMAPKGQS